MSPRKLFEQELEELRQDVLQMAEWVQDGYDCLFAALEKKDGDQMRRYVRHDRTIEDMQRNIESQCLSLLSRYSSAFPDMVRETRTLIGKAARAFVERNMAMGQEAIDADDGIDDFFNRIKEDLVKELKKDGSDADGCVDALMTAKYLEKIGDHGVNIGQWEIFQETGEIDEIRLL